MPFKDKGKQKEAVRKAVQKHRGITSEGITEKGITRYHPILYALTDPVKRDKLERICQALDRRKLQSKVSYGLGPSGVPFDVVQGLLEATG